jgi:hypothetical protein
MMGQSLAQGELRVLVERLDLEPCRETWVRLGGAIGYLARRKPYGGRYVVSVYNGSLQPGEPFAKAVKMLLRGVIRLDVNLHACYRARVMVDEPGLTLRNGRF